MSIILSSICWFIISRMSCSRSIYTAFLRSVIYRCLFFSLASFTNIWEYLPFLIPRDLLLSCWLSKSYDFMFRSFKLVSMSKNSFACLIIATTISTTLSLVFFCVPHLSYLLYCVKKFFFTNFLPSSYSNSPREFIAL